MRFLALTLATAATVAFASAQNSSAWAQESGGLQSGSGGNRGNAAGQERGPGGSALKQQSGQPAQSGNRPQSGSAGEGAGLRSEKHPEGVTSGKGRTTVGAHTSSRTGTSVRS